MSGGDSEAFSRLKSTGSSGHFIVLIVILYSQMLGLARSNCQPDLLDD